MLTSRHVWGECPEVAGTRNEVGIREFQELCHQSGYGSLRAFKEYLNGEGPDGQCTTAQYMARGRALETIQTNWIELWDC